MSDTAPTPHAPTLHAPRALWLIAQAFMHALHALFGNPEDIARAPYLSAKAYKQLALWIAAAEALLRRLLMIEAASAPIAPPPKSRKKRPSTPRAKVECFPDNPEAWPVSFRAFPAERRRARTRRQRLLFPRRIVDSWRLAVRYEALLRAYNNPTPYAARLARHLRAAPRRARSILRAPPTVVVKLITRDAYLELNAAADAPWRAPVDTS